MSTSVFPYSIHDFKIEEELGQQKVRKLNRVFKVSHKTLGIIGVMKHHKKQANTAHLADLVRNEAHFSFEHESFSSTLAFYETDQEILFIKSFAAGIPLNEYYTQLPKKLREAFLFTFLEKFVPIGEHLIREQLVHGDFKPGNFIIEGSGLDFKVSLIDFGLAFKTDAAPQRKIIFPLIYAAPELILNRLHLASHQSDLFALGICIYQLWEGKLPLVHPNPAILTNLQLTHPIPELNKRSLKLKYVVHRLCQKATFPKPPNLLTQVEVDEILLYGRNLRPQSVAHLLLDLKELNLNSTRRGIFRGLIKIFSKA